MSEEKSIMNLKAKIQRYKIPLGAISGIFFGLGAVLMKMAVSKVGYLGLFTWGEWIALIKSLPFWLMLVTNLLGLFFWFWALSRRRVSVVGPLMAGFMILIPIIVGITYFGESLSLMKIGGILILTTSSVLLMRKRP